MITVDKKWGKEEWLVNEEYCGKLLHINKGAKSSIHYHKVKKETFYCIEGQVLLTIDKGYYLLAPEEEPITIEPYTKHGFEGIDNKNILIEISTHHDEKDVVRLTESEG